MSHWDFLHPGLPDQPSVDTFSGHHPTGHFATDAIGHVQHVDAQGMHHGMTEHDPLGIAHHQDGHGVSFGSSQTDALGQVHHADAHGRELVHSWLDPLGIAHHTAANGVELAQTQVDAFGHVMVTHSAHGPAGAAPEASSFLDRLLTPR